MISSTKIDAWDISVIVIYFILFFVVGIYSMFKSMKSSSTDFFLAGRFITWLPVGASLFASNIGSEHFIGLAGSGAARGIGVGAFELNACLLLLLLGWFFLPVYLASGASTLPQYMKKRFNSPRIQLYLAFLSLILYVLTKLSVNLYAGYLFIHEALGWNIWFSVLFILGITTLITMIGGLVAVLYTDTFQCIIMIVGASILCIMSFIEIGGMEGLLNKYGSAFGSYRANSNVTQALVNIFALHHRQAKADGNEPPHGILTEIFRNDSYKSLTCGFPNDNAFKMLRKIDDQDLPWLGFILGQMPASVWYWCADQMMVQRVLAAKDISHAQGATIFAGLLKQLPLFLIIFPGLISRVLYADVIACSTAEDCIAACNQESGCSNLAYPKLIIDLMPSGLRGLMLSVMLAALVSDLTSIFNSASTIFSIDIYTKLRKNAKSKELIFVARLFIILLVVCSIIWIPIIQNFSSGQLFIYISAVTAYLSPPITSAFFVSLLWKGATELSVFLSLVGGFVIGMIRLILEFIYTEPSCGSEDNRPAVLAKIHYMYFAMILFVLCGTIVLVVSFIENAIEKRKIDESLRDIKALKRSNYLARLTYFDVKNEWDLFNAMSPSDYEELTEMIKKVDQEQAERLKLFQPKKKQGIKEKLKNYFWPIDKDDVTTNEIDEIPIGTVIRSKFEMEGIEDKKLIARLRQTPRQRNLLYAFLLIIVLLTCFLYIFYSVFYEPRNLGPLKLRLSNASAVQNSTKEFQGDPEPILSQMNLSKNTINDIMYLHSENLLTFKIDF